MLTKFYTQAVSTGEDQTELSLLLVNTKKKKGKETECKTECIITIRIRSVPLHRL